MQVFITWEGLHRICNHDQVEWRHLICKEYDWDPDNDFVCVAFRDLVKRKDQRDETYQIQLG